jgi:CheY-like chemotaxis protein
MAMEQLGILLLVDDSPDDAELVRLSFGKAGIGNPLKVVGSGEEAMAYLSGTGKYANRDEYPVPELILLDLKMPGVDGFEVLTWVKREPELSKIPVVVLTSSEQMKDVNRAYELGANSFLIKPFDFTDRIGLAQMVKHYWLGRNKGPAVERPKRQPNGSP